MPYPEYIKEEITEFRKKNPKLTWGMAPWDCIKLMKKEYEEANRSEEERLNQQKEKIVVSNRESNVINLGSEIRDFVDLYQRHDVYLPNNFKDIIVDIWLRNLNEFERVVKEQKGFDKFLILPGDLSLPKLKNQMIIESGYSESNNFKAGGSFNGAISQNTNKPCLVLVHKAQNFQDCPELQQTLNTRGKDVKLNQALTIEGYIIFQRKYFEETGKHIDDDNHTWTWLATKSGAGLIFVRWLYGARQLRVNVADLSYQFGTIGVRPARYFF